MGRSDEFVEENPPAQSSSRAVDLAAVDTCIEFKRKIGTAGGFSPNAEYVKQLDDYLEQSAEQAGCARASSRMVSGGCSGC